VSLKNGIVNRSMNHGNTTLVRHALKNTNPVSDKESYHQIKIALLEDAFRTAKKEVFQPESWNKIRRHDELKMKITTGWKKVFKFKKSLLNSI
jgi:hypothetical protein